MSISLISINDACASGASSIVASRVIASVNAEFLSPSAHAAPPPPPVAAEGHEVAPTMNIVLQDTAVWSHSKEREFSRLAALRATGKATREDQQAFRELQSVRRLKKNPVPADEVIFQYKRREMESKLLANLQDYVAFLESAHRS